MEISLRFSFRESEAGGTFQSRQSSVEEESQKSVKESSKVFAGSQDVYAEGELHDAVWK